MKLLKNIVPFQSPWLKQYTDLIQRGGVLGRMIFRKTSLSRSL